GLDLEDTDGDGEPDCRDACNGVDDASYVPDDGCGVGYCQRTNTPSSCSAGEETACAPGGPLSAGDATCDGVDDNCNGTSDEDYALGPPCGVGYCRDHSTPAGCVGGVVTQCQPAAPLAANDATPDGVDDDCDGAVDEDACQARTESFGAG